VTDPSRAAGVPSPVSARVDPRRTLGVAGEDAVAAWYQAAGYEVLERNWRRREGELDLVLARDRVVVFCEVKTRSTDAFGAPVEAITHQKRQRLRVLAAKWLDETKLVVREVRFDVASVRWPRNARAVIEVLEGAF
jgi:putative endonuclease